MLTDKLKIYHPNTTVHQMMFKKLMFLMSLYSLISWRKRKKYTLLFENEHMEEQSVART